MSMELLICSLGFVVVRTPGCCGAPHKQQVGPFCPPSPSQCLTQPSAASLHGSTSRGVHRCRHSSNTGSCAPIHVSAQKLANWCCHWGNTVSKTSVCGETVAFVAFPHHRGVFDRVSAWQVRGAPSLARWGLVWIKNTNYRETAN